MSAQIRAVPPLAELKFGERVGQVMLISFPIIAALTSQNLLNIVDTWIVGQLGSLELACVALGGTINWVLTAFFIGLGSGVQALVSRRVGEGNPNQAAGAINRALLFIAIAVVPLALVVSSTSEYILGLTTSRDEILLAGTPYLAVRLAGLPFTAANFSFRGYWNGLGMPNVYMRTLITIHIINVVLSYCLVFGIAGLPELGVFGAGVGTTVSQAVGTAYYFHLAQRVGVPGAFLRRSHLTPLRTLLKPGIPAGIQVMLFSMGFLIFFTLTESLGTAALGATQVLVTMALVSILPAVGFGLGSASLVGQAMGAGRPDDARTWGWLATGIGATSVGIIGLIEAATASFWMELFVATDPQAAALGVIPLQIIGCVMCIDAVGVILSNTLIGAGATARVMVWSVLTQYGVFLPLAWYLGVYAGLGLPAMWGAFAVYRLLFTTATILMWRGKSWQMVKL